MVQARNDDDDDDDDGSVLIMISDRLSCRHLEVSGMELVQSVRRSVGDDAESDTDYSLVSSLSSEPRPMSHRDRRPSLLVCISLKTRQF